MMNESNDRQGKDVSWLLSHPRELCSHCWEWVEGDGTPQNDMDCCAANIRTTCNYYLLGKSNECPYFMEW